MKLLSAGSSGDLGYAVGIERGRATVLDHGASGEIVLRVTHLFRRDNGRWAVIHRHARRGHRDPGSHPPAARPLISGATPKGLPRWISRPQIDDVLADLDRATELMLDGNCAP